MTNMLELKIEKLGSEGDGIGRHDGKPVFVANTLPGETVRVDGELPRPELVDVLEPSEFRQEPPCVYAKTCGNCTFQHGQDQLILDWKQREVAYAFANAGLEIEVEPTIATPHNARRRVTFTAVRAPALWGYPEFDGDRGTAFAEKPESFMTRSTALVVIWKTGSKNNNSISSRTASPVIAGGQTNTV